ncbi:hypothetical protein D9M68_403680 [compost metagenome]
MENKKTQFKTNINCSGCVAAVKPYLDRIEGICEWDVNTTESDKILTVKSAAVTEQQVMEAVQKAGFKIERLTAQ